MEERMEGPTKLVGFALGMVAASLGGAALGTAVGPVASDAETEHSGMHTDTAARAEVASELPGGLMVSQRGYTLALAQPTLLAGTKHRSGSASSARTARRSPTTPSHTARICTWLRSAAT